MKENRIYRTRHYGPSDVVNLLKAGYELSVFDINKEAVAALEAAGASGAGSPKEVAENSENYFHDAPEFPHVKEVISERMESYRGAPKKVSLSI